MEDKLVEVLPQLLTIVTALLGGVLLVMKKVTKVGKEFAEFLLVIHEAMADGKITPAEMRMIIKEAKDIPAAIANIKK